MEPTQTTESHNNSEITLQQAIDQARAARALTELADGDRIRCLDSDTLFCGDDGFMLPEYTGDGVHPYGKFAYLFSQWLCEQITQGK